MTERERTLSRNLKSLQDHVARCAKLLGCLGIDDNVEASIKALKAEHKELQSKYRSLASHHNEKCTCLNIY